MKLRYLSQAPLFADLPEAQLEQIADKMQLQRFSKGQTLFTKGAPSQAFYAIKSGWVRLTVEGSSVATLGAGSLLGEEDLLTGQPHSTGAIATHDVEAWSVSLGDLDAIVSTHPALGQALSTALGRQIAPLVQYLFERRLRPVPALSELTDQELMGLANELELVSFPAESMIFCEGDCADGMFVIEQGSAELVSSCEQGECVRLGAGDMLGEMALLSGKAHISTARTLEPTLIWVLSSASFSRLLDKYPSIRRTLSANLRQRLGANDQQLATEKLRELPLFSNLPSDALAGVAAALQLRVVPAGETVYSAGDPGDALYLIEAGSASAVNARGLPDRKAGQWKEGEFFGESEILSGKSRSATVRATTDANLWVLARTDFERLCGQYPALSLAMSRQLGERLARADRTLIDRRLRDQALLLGLTDEQLEDVQGRLRPVRFRAGETILEEGAEGDNMYLIGAGQVEVLTGDSSPYRLALLSDGDFFGEIALLTGRPRTATVVARTNVDLWELDKAGFDTLTLKYPSLTATLSRVLGQRLNSLNSHSTTDDLQPAMVRASGRTAVRPVVRDRQPVVRRAPARARDDGLDRSTVGALEGLRRAFEGTSSWFGEQTTATKIRVVALVILLAWLIGIAAPSTVINALADTRVNTENNALALVQTMPTAVAELVENTPIPPTVTFTPVPPTATETPLATYTPVPTETPVPATATETALPPTATFTPLPPTETVAPPAPKPTVAQQAVAAAAQPKAAEPTNTSVPAPAPVAKAQPAAQWDPRLDSMGVHIAPVDVAAGQPFFRIVSALWANEAESQGKHHIYVNVLDEAGNRMVGQQVVIQYGGGQDILTTEDKPAPEYSANFPMYAVLGTYNVLAGSLPSETLVGCGMGLPELPKMKFHTTFYVTFQKAVR